MSRPDNSLKISIVTVCLNAEAVIRRAIESVTQQTYGEIEYIVIDGASRDNTMKEIERFRSVITTIVSERDDGIYDAMNKGLSLATGEVIYFLNSDDRLYDANVIAEVMQKFSADDSLDLLIGNVAVEQENTNGEIIRPGKACNRRKELYNSGFCHQGLFTRSAVFQRAGNFDTRYKIVADYDWMLRACEDTTSQSWDRNVAYFDVKGYGSQQNLKRKWERLLSVCRNCTHSEILIYLSKKK